jgi:hypothetical protein
VTESFSISASNFKSLVSPISLLVQAGETIFKHLGNPIKLLLEPDLADILGDVLNLTAADRIVLSEEPDDYDNRQRLPRESLRKIRVRSCPDIGRGCPPSLGQNYRL